MQGSILFNGNIVFEVDFIRRFQDRICESNHEVPEVRASKKALLICAAWGEREYTEPHIKAALREAGIPSDFDGGYDRNIQNLSAWHAWRTFMNRHPDIAELYNDSLSTIERVKQFYREKNAALIGLLRRHTAMVKARYPQCTLADILGYNVSERQPELHNAQPKALHFHHCCHEIQGTLQALIDSDDRQAQICEEVHEYFFLRSNIYGQSDYRQTRQKLIDNILSSASIFLFGGSIQSLYYTLRFWRLDEALRTALAMGANFYGTSAGAMVLCEKIIVFDDFGEERGEGKREFEFFDHGLGLVRKIKLFPHCMERVKTDDPDNLCYLAHRFEGTTCVGLNEESFLSLETTEHDGRNYESFISVGAGDGVYVFDPSGGKLRVDHGQHLRLPGTWAQMEARREASRS